MQNLFPVNYITFHLIYFHFSSGQNAGLNFPWYDSVIPADFVCLGTSSIKNNFFFNFFLKSFFTYKDSLLFMLACFHLSSYTLQSIINSSIKEFSLLQYQISVMCIVYFFNFWSCFSQLISLKYPTKALYINMSYLPFWHRFMQYVQHIFIPSLNRWE